MPGTSITINDITKGPFNLYNVLAGVQTTGLTVAQTFPSIGRNCQRRNLQADYLNGSKKVFVASDGSVSTTSGIGLVAGDPFNAESQQEDISLTELWFTADTNAAKLNVNVE